jgi:hypothetical protein
MTSWNDTHFSGCESCDGHLRLRGVDDFNTCVFSDEVIADPRLIIVVADGHRMMITDETCGGHLQLSDDLANSEAR